MVKTGKLSQMQRATYIRQLELLHGEDGDKEYSHRAADIILITVLRAFGEHEIVAAWEKVPKWYA